jgi:hypothetical protein
LSEKILGYVKGPLSATMVFYYVNLLLFGSTITDTLKVNSRYDFFLKCYFVYFILLSVFYGYILTTPLRAYVTTKTRIASRVSDVYIKTPDDFQRLNDACRDSDELK